MGHALSRNLRGFNLTTNAIPKDGHCTFRFLARMLSSVCDPQQPEISSHLKSIGLCKSEDEDTITMRNLFVNEILKCDDEILAFFPEQSKEEITTKALQFRRQGMFDTAIGDVVMRVCTQLLRLPIMVVIFSQLFAMCSLHSQQPNSLQFQESQRMAKMDTVLSPISHINQTQRQGRNPADKHYDLLHGR